MTSRKVQAYVSSGWFFTKFTLNRLFAKYSLPNSWKSNKQLSNWCQDTEGTVVFGLHLGRYLSYFQPKMPYSPTTIFSIVKYIRFNAKKLFRSKHISGLENQKRLSPILYLKCYLITLRPTCDLQLLNSVSSYNGTVLGLTALYLKELEFLIKLCIISNVIKLNIHISPSQIQIFDTIKSYIEGSNS
jgi:hypothetical protein